MARIKKKCTNTQQPGEKALNFHLRINRGVAL